MNKVIQFEPTKEYLEKFREALENKDDSFIGETLGAEKLASTQAPKAGGYAEAKLTN